MRIVRSVTVVVALAAVTGCDSKEESEAKGLEAIASGSLAVRQALSAAASAVPKEPENVVRHVGADETLTLTDAIRSRLESRHPEAAGFVTVEDIEKKLFALDLKRGNDDEALKHIDRIAKGKWILMTGPVTAATPEGFELPIRYTPRDPADPMGLTSQWISVKLTGVEGFDAKEYRPGEKTAALVKYDGGGKASKGFDLIMLRQWYE
jgi:hypothetical protein